MEEAQTAKITVLYDNRKDDPGLQEGWGFSCLIEVQGRKILFDSGADQTALFSNAHKLGLNWNEISHVFFSHKHADHIAGFHEVIEKVTQKTEIFLPRSFPRALFKKASSKARVRKMYSFKEIDSGIYSLVLRGGFLLYEQSLVLKTSKGTAILTGCAHPGIISIIEETKKRIPGPIYFVMGGFHLFRSSAGSMAETIEQFRLLGVQKVAPCHCSGDRMIQLFEDVYEDQFVKIGTGTILTI
jgi:7,8-dihydropterin-6-yl-methyl-4-(beta-D-ribofuranosyl)aminobenzene 5'-phosphate synthase